MRGGGPRRQWPHAVAVREAGGSPRRLTTTASPMRRPHAARTRCAPYPRSAQGRITLHLFQERYKMLRPHRRMRRPSEVRAARNYPVRASRRVPHRISERDFPLERHDSRARARQCDPRPIRHDHLRVRRALRSRQDLRPDQVRDLDGPKGAVAKAVGNRVRRLRRDDGTASGGEINAALGGRLAEGLPTIDLTHADLT